ncbi:2-hydroxychromene-2-carboxylate isomerase [Undibacterium sp. TJN25]|uniref:2-hydroxychromene-2-carboxylate isomerase n=1 Tax=Undibacterium sp. TJN25 TaxID=3413056 RepID=UPI003BF3CD94
MSKQVEFYYDFGSPYTYLAYHHLPVIAARQGAEIIWKPVLLGGIFQATGNHSPAEIPLKAEHSQVDLERWAKRYGVNFTMNPYFPINTLTLMRGATGMQLRGKKEFDTYNAAVFHAMFEEPKNLNDPAQLAAVLAAAGFDAADFMAMISNPEVKDLLKKNTEQAVQRKIFGAPSFFVGEEFFWGQDRLDFVEEALTA